MIKEIIRGFRDARQFNEPKEMLPALIATAFYNGATVETIPTHLIKSESTTALLESFTAERAIQDILNSPSRWHELRDMVATQVIRGVLLSLAMFAAGVFFLAVTPSLWVGMPLAWKIIAFAGPAYGALGYFARHSYDLVLLRRWAQVYTPPEFNSGAKFGQTQETPHVPRNAQYLLWFILPRAGRRDAISDLNDEFKLICVEQDLGRAQKWYWGEVLDASWDAFGPFLGRLARWTTFGSIVDWIRRHI